jgi:hypothetical protein
MVMVITPKRDGDRTDAMLQLRTPANSARELSRLSHLAGHILQEDRLRPSGQAVAAPPETFGLADETPLSAAGRVVQEVSADDLSGAIRPVTTGRYLYPNMEHLFFFVFVLDLPEGIQFPRRAEMHSFRLTELLAIRSNQVMKSVLQLCREAKVSERGFAAAAEILAANLILHDRPDFAADLLGLADKPVSGGEALDAWMVKKEALAVAISEKLVEWTVPSWSDPNQEVSLGGLAGWQHREFFSVLLHLYADIGVDGARDLLDKIDEDSSKSDAVQRLIELYRDEATMASVPLEL